jgi:hypothetical protein
MVEMTPCECGCGLKKSEWFYTKDGLPYRLADFPKNQKTYPISEYLRGVEDGTIKPFEYSAKFIAAHTPPPNRPPNRAKQDSPECKNPCENTSDK